MKLIEKNQADTQTNAACEAEKFPNPVDDIVPGWSIDPVTGERFFTSPKGTTFFAGSGGLRAAVGDRAPAPVCGWIEVVSEGCNRDGKGFKRLVRFKDRRGVMHRLMLDLSDIGGNPGAVCKRLLDDGLPLYSVTQQGGNAQLVDFLLNAPVRDQFTAADSYGWFERGGMFVLPAGAVGIPSDGVKVEPPGDDTGAPMYSQAGTLEEWKATIGMDARHSSRIAFAICIAFAAPLLAFTDEGSGGFHFVGKSSQGKSTAMKALCSVWAQAVEGCGELASWRSTDNGLEAVAAAHTDLPLILDELKQAERSVEQALYMLANGAGKRRQTRGLKAQKPLTWRTLYASTGELTADELAAQYGKEVATGANVRMANIPAVPEGGAFGVFETVPQGMTPEALAENGVQLAAATGGLLCPVMNARREQVFNALFEVRDGQTCRLCADRALPMVELGHGLAEDPAYAGRPVLLTGDGAAMTAQVLAGILPAECVICLPERDSRVSAYHVAQCALRAYRAGVRTTDAELTPVYLRMSQAERTRAEKLAQNAPESERNE